MTVQDLIITLLDMPMDMEVGIGIDKDNDPGLHIFAINTADILEIDTPEKEKDLLVVLFHEEEIDHTLN